MKHVGSRRLIGISVGKVAGWRDERSYYDSYARAIERAGGKCAPLGHGASTALSDCAGLLVPGGWDVHPNHYARRPGDESLTVDELIARYHMTCDLERDEVDLLMIAEALERKLPVLAICKGFQVLNVVLGHKLIPDIGEVLPNALVHKSTGDGVSLSHEIEIEPDSLVARAYRAQRIVVNTRHHQGVTADMVSDRLRVTALAPDGVVEAVESRDGRFVVGVQWHPEREKDAFIHDISAGLFKAFVAACAADSRSSR
jgi:putative glutamine amidotransferase